MADIRDVADFSRTCLADVEKERHFEMYRKWSTKASIPSLHVVNIPEIIEVIRRWAVARA